MNIYDLRADSQTAQAMAKAIAAMFSPELTFIAGDEDATSSLGLPKHTVNFSQSGKTNVLDVGAGAMVKWPDVAVEDLVHAGFSKKGA